MILDNLFSDQSRYHLKDENFVQVPGPKSLQLMKENDRLQVEFSS